MTKRILPIVCRALSLLFAILCLYLQAIDPEALPHNLDINDYDLFLIGPSLPVQTFAALKRSKRQKLLISRKVQFYFSGQQLHVLSNADQEGFFWRPS